MGMKKDYNWIINSMKGLLCSFTELNHSMGPNKNPGHCSCLYKQTYMHVAMFTTVRMPAPFFLGGGGAKCILFSLFLNNKASFKGIYTLNGIHMWVFFNTESLNARATHFK